MTNIKGLDTLRAFAVFFVVFAHFGVWFDDNTKLTNFIHYALIPDGGFGVRLFFVLSGFLITSILLNAKNTYPDENRLVIIKNFFVRRALRIFPIYYLLLFTLFIINYPDVRQYIWYFATYTSNILPYRTNSWNFFSHTWTLSVEEQFYLLWPWLIIFINNKYLKYLFFTAILTGAITTYIALDVQGHMAPLLVFHSFDAFGIGALYALARLDSKQNKLFERVIKILLIPALCMYFVWKVTFVLHIPLIKDYFSGTIYCIIYIWLIMITVNNRSAWVSKYFLGSKPLNFLGKISYGIYLYHYPYIYYSYPRLNNFLFTNTATYPGLNKVLHNMQVNYVLHVSIIVIIATVSYKLIESPLLNLKKRFKYNDRKTQTVTSPTQKQ